MAVGSLVLGYDFVEDSGLYAGLGVEGKREVEGVLLRELLRTYTVELRARWLQFPVGGEFLTREAVEAEIERRLPDLPGDRVGLSYKEDPSVRYMLIGTREHRVTHTYWLARERDGAMVPWHLPVRHHEDGRTVELAPRVFAMLSWGYPFSLDLLSFEQRFAWIEQSIEELRRSAHNPHGGAPSRFHDVERAVDGMRDPEKLTEA